MKKPKPAIKHRLWPDSSTGRAVGYASVNVSWNAELEGWEVWRETSPGHRIVLHGWPK